MHFLPPDAVHYAPVTFSNEELSAGYNGVFRASIPEVRQHMPHMNELMDLVVDMLRNHGCEPADWEVDIKVHMLMPGQYPCIPNWHCDNVPRGENGKVNYGLAEEKWVSGEPPMFLWVSDGPCTEFLCRPVTTGEGHTPADHAELAGFLNDLLKDVASVVPTTQLVRPGMFYAMNRLTPHRGTVAAQHGWRVFLRLTHKSCLPDRPKVAVIRRHSQVYLDSAKFGW